MEGGNYDLLKHKNSRTPLKVKTHGFNAKIGFEIYAPSLDILAKMYPNLAFQSKYQRFLTFLPISHDSVHIFQNRFLR